MNPREATDPTDAGFDESQEFGGTGSEPPPDDISTAGTTQVGDVGGASGEAVSGSGGAADTGVPGWSDLGETAGTGGMADTGEPPPTDIANAGTSQVDASQSTPSSAEGMSEH